LFGIAFDGSGKGGLCLLVPAKTEERSGEVVVVDGIVRF
jgi:hypothetical protein